MVCLSIASTAGLCNLVTAFRGDNDDVAALGHSSPLQLHILTNCGAGFHLQAPGLHLSHPGEMAYTEGESAIMEEVADDTH